MAGGGAPPASPGLGAGGAAPNGQGGFVQSTQDTLRGIYQNIAKANPNIKPSALFEAAQLQIGQMKGIEPDTKMYMQAQIAEQKIDMEAKMKAMGAESASEVARIKADSAKEIAELRAKIATLLQDKKDNTAVAVGAGHDRARITGAGIGAAARENVADKNNKTKLDLEDRRDKNRLEVTDKVTDRTLSAEQTRRMAKENAMALFKNKTPPYPNLKTDSGKTDMGYSSAADVKKAYQAGDLTHDQASKILKSNGWAQ
jgi:hypothetical protein